MKEATAPQKEEEKKKLNECNILHVFLTMITFTIILFLHPFFILCNTFPMWLKQNIHST